MKSNFNTFKLFYEELLDILFPRFCIGCQVRGENICQNCIGGMKRTEKDANDSIYAYFDYKDPLVRKAIWDLKYHKRSHIGRDIGRLLYENLIEEIADMRMYAGGRGICVMPVPLSKKRLRMRGYNQARMIARGICDYADENILELRDGIVTKKDSPPQARISNRTERLKNIKDCFQVTKPSDVKGRTIIIVDDVTTTGGTISEMMKVLKKSGAKKVIGVAFAH